jgi:membrane protein DedA with SNARE-associated domain
MFQQLTDLVGGSISAYPIIFAIVAGDAVFPLLPGETAVVTGAILAANGKLSVELVLLSAWIGAMVGDNASWAIGRYLGRRAADRLFRGAKGRSRLEWAAGQLRRRGVTIIILARFIPGGRTATTFSAGTLGMPWVRFAAADAAGCLLWAAFATALGYFGGATFKQSLWQPLLLAASVAVVIAGVGEAWRRLSGRRDRRRAAAEG